PARDGPRVQRAEVVARHEERPDLLDPAIGRERDRLPAFRRDDVESADLRAKILERRPVEVAVRICRRRAHDPAEPLDARENEWVIEQGIDGGEGDGVDAHSDGQRQDGERGKAGPPYEIPAGVAKVSKEGIHRSTRRRLADECSVLDLSVLRNGPSKVRSGSYIAKNGPETGVLGTAQAGSSLANLGVSILPRGSSRVLELSGRGKLIVPPGLPTR